MYIPKGMHDQYTIQTYVMNLGELIIKIYESMKPIINVISTVGFQKLYAQIFQLCLNLCENYRFVSID